MSKTTIDLTEQQEYFLKKFALNHYPGSKDNVGTCQPVHFVQTQRSRFINPDYTDADEIEYYVPEREESYRSPQELIEAYYDGKECPIEIESYEEAYKASRFIDVEGEEQVICDEKDYLAAYGVDERFYRKIYTEFYYETVAVFFILDEAKKYIEYQGHNLTKPRTYTVSGGYANNGEYHHFWELLFNLGKHLNDNPIPEGYIEIERTFCLEKFKQVGIELECVTGVYIGKGEMVITGHPDSDDEAHNCDDMGFSSVSHVLYRQSI